MPFPFPELHNKFNMRTCLELLPLSGKNHMLADIVAIIGTLDVVFGEVDR